MKRRFRTGFMVLALAAIAAACGNHAPNDPPLRDAARYMISPNQVQYSGGDH